MNDDYNAAVTRRRWLEHRVVDWEQRVQTLLNQATEARHEIEICKAELHGIELGLGARATLEADCDEPASEARGATAAEAEDTTRRRRRGEVQAIVHDHLMAIAPTGATAHELAATLGLRKAQVDRVLDHHRDGGRVKMGDPSIDGSSIWYAVRPGVIPTFHEDPTEPADEDDDRLPPDAAPDFELKDQPHD